MKKIFILLFAAALLVAGCTKEESDANTPGSVIPSGGNSGNSGGSGSGTNDEVAQNVNKHVKATYSVDRTRYRYIINVTSTLASVYPNKTIKYRVEYGYSDNYDPVYYWYDEETQVPARFNLNWYRLPNESYMQEELDYLEGNGISRDDIDDIAFYGQTFCYYWNKKDNGETLTSTEQELLEDAAELMENSGVNDLQYLLNVRVCVVVDGVVYPVGKI